MLAAMPPISSASLSSELLAAGMGIKIILGPELPCVGINVEAVIPLEEAEATDATRPSAAATA
eukprot:9023660-Lingulodinium_polyedra.AAC.1